MRILLVYPRSLETFWSFSHALAFISKKSTFPPLGLITVAAMLPDDWDKRLLDMNVEPIGDDDIPLGRLCIYQRHGNTEGIRKMVDPPLHGNDSYAVRGVGLV